MSLFTIVKPTCVALLASANLTPSTTPKCQNILDQLVAILQAHSSELPDLSPSLVSYIFFPISTILQRNAPPAIPDQVFEKILIVLGLLSESWWWHCEIGVWEQIFMLCSSVLGGIANKGKGKERDDQVKEAAAQCIFILLRERVVTPPTSIKAREAGARLQQFRTHAQAPHFTPVLGETLNAAIASSESKSFSLQKISLKILHVLLDIYAPDQMFPLILPGVISTMSKVALATKLQKQWANGEIVADSLAVMQIAVVRTIGDDICIKEGALQRVDNLEDLVELVTPSVRSLDSQTGSSRLAKRTPSWLKGTTSQLHIAINNLNALTAHPSPAALHGLTSFARHVLEATPLSLPQTQPLLLAFLLSISNSTYNSVASDAQRNLTFLLSPSCKTSPALLATLMQNMSEYLSALPRLVSIQEERKILHLAGLIEATCRLASDDSGNATISKGIGNLLGPSGGIEKWGWSLLPAFEFIEAPVTVINTSSEQLMLENNPDAFQLTSFPALRLKNLGDDSLKTLGQMFRALGRAGGEKCLYSVEWFIGKGKTNTNGNAVAALWCTCRLLEGISGIELSSDCANKTPPKATRRLEKLARSLARSLAELWDRETGSNDETQAASENIPDAQENSLIEHKKGFVPIHASLKIIRSSPTTLLETSDQPVNHRVLTLQVISICVGILQSRSSSLFIHILYPVLHSLVSQVSFLASTAYASLQFITVVSSYASPANLLLSNFDYALDSISRRLTRRWLDLDATQVLVMLVRLVGVNVVEKAGDVVEECFDRLDEFHGYAVLVEGLVAVLVEVTNVLKDDHAPKPAKEPKYTLYARMSDLSEFLSWYRKQHETETEEKTDYGPAPRMAWGEEKQHDEEEEKEAMDNTSDPNNETPLTPTQALTKQIVARSMYFLTHGSPTIRAHILNLLASSVPNLAASAVMPTIHSAWPFILNRLSDQETFVVSAAASLVETLATYTGEFMFRRIWDDVWPRFKTILSQLQAGDANNALVQRKEGAIGTESAYTHSHRLYRSLLNTMAAALQDVHIHESSFWDVLLLFRRFLGKNVHPELQQCAIKLFKAAMSQNDDIAWLVLEGTSTQEYPVLSFLYNSKWDIVENARVILV